MVALNAMTENLQMAGKWSVTEYLQMAGKWSVTEYLQMAGKWSVTEYLQMAGKWLLWVGCVYDNSALCESNMSESCTELDLQACVD